MCAWSPRRRRLAREACILTSAGRACPASGAGATAKFRLEPDTGERTAAIPPELLRILSEERALLRWYRALNYSTRHDIANFKLREGLPIGCRVTLRRDAMYEFFDRLIATALPRIRDFRGLSPRSFDGRGNYSLGVGDQTIFPEIELDKIKRQQGMDITIVTSARTNEEALDLLKLMGMPFAEAKQTEAKQAKAAQIEQKEAKQSN